MRPQGRRSIGMKISIQYLEGTAARDRISPAEARGRLRAAFDHIQFDRVMLGWDLQPRIIEACAEECARRGAELYLWQPILVGHGPFRSDVRERVVALDKVAAGQAEEPIEFTFMCPNRAEVRERALECLSDAVSGGWYQGVLLDRIRWPSPALGPTRNLGCFCESCAEAAASAGLDLEAARGAILDRLATPDGRRVMANRLLKPGRQAKGEADDPIGRTLDFRAASITALVKEIAEAMHARGMKVGLDCYAPTLTRMVGQDLSALAAHADWTKVMTYARAFGRASLPFELEGLTDWLMAGGETEASALACLSEATGWQLPSLREVIRGGGLGAAILTEELRRGRAQVGEGLLAGIEVLEIPDVSMLNRQQIQKDAMAVRAGEPDGVVLSWDLWHMPEWRLEMAASLYGE